MIKTLYPIFQKWSEKGSVYIISDTHFNDPQSFKENPNWLTAEEIVANINKVVTKSDTLIHLGDVGDVSYMSQIKGYKVLLLGNHDQSAEKFKPCFDEIYTGPLFIADRILLSHEPIYGLEEFTVNIHGHTHFGESSDTHINLACDVGGFKPYSLGEMINNGLLSKTKSIHRISIDGATERKEKGCNG